jgi:hypothetical protein
LRRIVSTGASSGDIRAHFAHRAAHFGFAEAEIQEAARGELEVLGAVPALAKVDLLFDVLLAERLLGVQTLRDGIDSSS